MKYKDKNEIIPFEFALSASEHFRQFGYLSTMISHFLLTNHPKLSRFLHIFQDSQAIQSIDVI